MRQDDWSYLEELEPSDQAELLWYVAVAVAEEVMDDELS